MNTMSSNFTEAELKVLLRGWICIDGGMPKMDHDKLATVCGFKSKASASTRWSEAKKKLVASFGEEGTADPGDDDVAAVKKATPRKRSAAKAEVDENGEVKPKKRGRRSKAEIAAAKEAAEALEELGMKVKEEGEDDGEELLAGIKEYAEKKKGGGTAGAAAGWYGE